MPNTDSNPRANLPPQLKQDIERVDAVVANTDGPREYHITMQQSMNRIIQALVEAQGAQPGMEELKAAAEAVPGNEDDA